MCRVVAAAILRPLTYHPRFNDDSLHVRGICWPAHIISLGIFSVVLSRICFLIVYTIYIHTSLSAAAMRSCTGS